MSKDITTQKWNLIGFIKVSPVRYAVLKALEGKFLMPIEISKQTGFTPSQVSNALHGLKENELVICQNEEIRKGRIYQNTSLGSELLQIIDKQ